jgi:hypothetical protein
VLLAFACSLELFGLLVEVLGELLTKILEIMGMENLLGQQERKDVSYISDSFHFWSLLREKLMQEMGNVEKKMHIGICLDGFF